MPDHRESEDQLIPEVQRHPHREGKRSKQAARKNEDQFRNLVENSDQGIYIQIGLKPVYVNQAMADMFRYDSKEEILKMDSFLELVSPADRQRNFDFYRARMSSQNFASHYEFEGITKDGSLIWLDRTLTRIIWYGESATVVTLVDITDQKRNERQLAKSDERFRNLVEGSMQGIVVHRHHIPLFANDAYARGFGYPNPSEILKLNLLEQIVAPHERPRILGYYNALMKGDSAPTQYIFEGIRKDGSKIQIECVNKVIDWEGVPAILSTQVNITNRKKAEQDLRRSEERYRNLVEGSIQGILIQRDQKPLFLNKAFAEILGYDSPEEILQLGSLVPLVDKEDAVRQTAYRKARLKGQDAPHQYVGQGVRKDGSKIWLETFVTVVDWEGEPAVQIAVVDVTERKRMEETLKESEEKFRNLAEGSIQGILIQRDQKPLFINRAFAKLLGYDSPEEIYHLGTLAPLVPPEERERLTAYRKARMKGDPAPGHYEGQALRKDGSQIWIETLVNVVAWEGQSAVLATGVDVTERKQAEEALRLSEEKLRAILNNAPFSFSLKDLEGRYIFVNRCWEVWYGSTITEAIGKTSYEFFQKEDVAHFRKQENEVIRTGSVIEVEREVSARDGTRKNTLDTKFPVFDGRGQITGVGTITADLTQYKKLEAELHHAQKMESIGTLAGGIAHNFNNLLQIISGNISIMGADMDASHPHYEYLSTVEKSIQRGSDLTYQILGFARSGKYVIKPTNLNEVVDRTIAMVIETHKEIRIVKKYQERLLPTDVDQSQIEQVLLNIFINAIHAMPNGGQLTLQTENVNLDDNFTNFYELPSGTYVKLSIADTGTGMDQETQARIFEPFFTTDEMGQGTGLGLASTYGIIKSHEGIITVESEIGKGATFNIFLPAIDQEIVEKIEPPKEEHKGTGTILFVDDEEDIVAVGQNLLERLGYDVLTANSGDDALEAFEKNNGKIDLVMLDMIMPGMGGGDVFDKLRELDPNVKVLLLSGFSIEGKAAGIMERGCDGFIQKPFNLETLSDKIREVLDSK